MDIFNDMRSEALKDQCCHTHTDRLCGGACWVTVSWCVMQLKVSGLNHVAAVRRHVLMFISSSVLIVSFLPVVRLPHTHRLRLSN